MKKFLVAVALLACVGGVAFAGPNQHGTIFVHDANLVYTVDTASYCGLGTPPASCEGADVQVNGAADPSVAAVFKVYAAFCPESQPRLKGIAFGVYYDAPVRIVAYGNCAGDMNNGAAEIMGPNWPGNGTGTAVIFQNTMTGILSEIYWFAGYNYYAEPGVFRLGPHPDPVLGGNFVDDSIPAQQDPIAGYGSLGFDVPGQTACPDPAACGGGPVLGACCYPDGHCEYVEQSQCGTGDWREGVPCEPDNPCPPPDTAACCIGEECTVTTRDDCAGNWLPEFESCDPNPCVETPVHESTWGQIKANYR